MTPVPVAVVGCGHLGAIHAHKLHRNPGFQLTHLVDPCPGQRDELARETGAVATKSHAELNGIQAAIVATPTRDHCSIAADLMRQGIHVLVEKPLTADSHQAALLCQLARQHNRILQVGHVERFNPALIATRDRLREPKYIEARRTSGFTFRSVDIGAVFDLMIHDIDIVLQLDTTPVVDVKAFGWAMLSEREDTVQARLQLASGCLVDLFASRVSPQRQRQLTVWGDDYSAELDLAQGSAVITSAGEEIRGRQFDAEQLSPTQRSELDANAYQALFTTEQIVAPKEDAIEAEHANFLGAIQGQQVAQVDGPSGLRAVELAERILESIECHAWDGNSSGRLGPRFEQPPQILRPPQWQPHRKAG